MRIPIFLILLVLYCAGCKSGEGKLEQIEKFDKTKWAVKKELNYPYRADMLHDLVYNVKLKGLKKDELTRLLGQPDRSQEGHLYYRIYEKRMGAVILTTKTLVIKINNDTVEWRKIHG